MSDNLIPISDEQSKAVQAAANVTGKAIDAVTDLGKFLGRALGTLPEDAVGLLGADWVSHVRTRNAHRLQMRTEEILAARNADVEPLSLSVAKPLLDAAQDESRDELVELWARLLANAMDRGRPPIRRTFIDTLRAFDPIDVLIMHHTDRNDRYGWIRHDDWPQALKINADEVQISLQHLLKLNCLDFAREFKPSLNGWCHSMSPYGREMMRAVSP